MVPEHVVLVLNNHGCKGEPINLIPCYMIDIIYKTVKPSRLKKLRIIQNIINLMFQVILIFSDWIFIKQIIVCSTPFCCWRKQIFERMLPGGMSNFVLPRAWWKNLRASFEWGGAWVKMPRINALPRNVNSINLKIFLTHGGT